MRRGEDRKEAGSQGVRDIIDCLMARDIQKEAAKVKGLSHFG